MIPVFYIGLACSDFKTMLCLKRLCSIGLHGPLVYMVHDVIRIVAFCHCVSVDLFTHTDSRSIV